MEEIISYLYSLCHQDCISYWNLPTTKHQSGKDIVQFPQGIKGNFLEQTISTPAYTSYLHLTWWARDISIFINSELVQTGDLFDQKCYLLLAPSQTYHISIHLDSPAHDRGALMQSVLAIANAYFPIWQDISLIDIYLSVKKEPSEIDQLAQVTALIGELELWFRGDRSLEHLQTLHQQLVALAKLYVPQNTIHLLGNAHIDIAWLWAIAETKQVLERTFNSVLQLQSQYPELIFNQSSAVTYQWIEQEYPDLFHRISDAVTGKRWEITGGMWVEPDCNIPSGESLIRQILYGKQYFQEKFGTDIKIAWLPDSFGFNWQLPQILVKSGFDFFVTQKLSWNDTHKFPYNMFYWQGLDGTKVFTYFTNLIGEGIDPVAIAKYLVTQNHDALWLFGVGDHGGGPTADMLNIARKWRESPLCPAIKHTSMYDFLKQLSETIDSDDLPIWQDELYLEFHRGTYTSKADHKLKHRQAENKLLNLEKLCTVFCLFAQVPYPKAQIDSAWRKLLVNQFHDIVTGSSIPEVFQDADVYWQEIEATYQGIILSLTQPVEHQFTVWNLNNWTRYEIIALPIDSATTGVEVFVNQQIVPYQIIGNRLYLPASVPAFSAVQVHWRSLGSGLSINHKLPQISCQQLEDILLLENQFIIVSICKQTGNILRIIDKRYDHQLLSSPIHWKFYQDRGQYWDAWNIDPQYENYQLPSARLISLEVQSVGSVIVQVTASYQFQSSHIKQEIEIDCFNPWITVRNLVDWQESHILAKVVFPVSFTTNYATYEIPMGVIQRCVQDQAKWEVPAQYWADISSNNIGLAVINDCKYGYSAKPDMLCLTALRSPEWPCPHSDRGIHKFNYLLAPHNGSWQDAQIVHLAHNFNSPLLVLNSISCSEKFTQSILNISSTNVILSCWKQSYNQQDWIMRLYEAYGRETCTNITLAETLKLESVVLCDLIENFVQNITVNHLGNCFSTHFQPYEIKTFRLSLTPAPVPTSSK
jgi:Alpha-mannosidase